MRGLIHGLGGDPIEITTMAGFRMLMMFAIPVPRKRAVSFITSVAYGSPRTTAS